MVSSRWTGRGWAAALAAWTGLAGLSTLQTALYLEQRGHSVDWAGLVTSHLVDWYTCFAFAPLVLWLVRRSSLGAGHRLRLTAGVVGAAILFVPIKYAILSLIMQWLQPDRRAMTMSAALGANFFAELLFLIGIALAVYTIELYRVVQGDQLERGRLGRELAEAKLDALMLQLEPHFLFNTLNSAVSLIARSPRAAEDMITDLSGMLQATLRPGSREVPLSAELEQLDAYLRIMRHRFGERLTAHIDVAAPARSALVPRFLLQPLVENAIEHGFDQSDGVGNIIIRGRVQDSTLTLAVVDNGDGFPAHSNGSSSCEGIGLANTRRRLAQMYGEDCTLTISSKPGGTAVAITLPHRTQTGVTT